MLFTQSGLAPGDTVLVQGAGGGVATALISLAAAAGLRVWVTSRDEAKGARALELGAAQAFSSGARLPDRVDAVMETVGEATWSHSLKALAARAARSWSAGRPAASTRRPSSTGSSSCSCGSSARRWAPATSWPG